MEKNEKIQTLQLINSLGQTIKLTSTEISSEKNYYLFEIDPATLNLSSGIYYLKLKSDKTERTVKLIHQSTQLILTFKSINYGNNSVCRKRICNNNLS